MVDVSLHAVYVNDPAFPIIADANGVLVATDNGQTVARCTLWWSGDIPTLPGEPIGIVGQYAASNDVAAARLLHVAGDILRSHGCTRMIGPMDGNTWRSYRFVRSRNPDDAPEEPSFFLEPANPPEYPVQFSDAGFTPLATYSSRLATDLSHRDERAGEIQERLAAGGVTIRPLRRDDIESELHRIYELCCISFRHNYLYTPLPESEFVGSYHRILPYLDPELVLLAEVGDGTLAGFLFALPDLAEKKRGEPVKTVIVKTVAVLPDRSFAGLGRLLLDDCHQRAHSTGFTRAIHALMHDSNASRNLSKLYGGNSVLRRYTLYERAL